MFPKPRPSGLERHDRKRDKDRQAAAMRAAVWARDKSQCLCCGQPVSRSAVTLERRGEVHHLRGRRVAPKDVLKPEACVLLCGTCHLKITAHEIEVAGVTAATFRRVR